MRKKKIFISLLGCFVVLTMAAQTSYNFSFTTLSGDYSRPDAGSERWNENSGSQTVSGYPATLNYYRRFTIRDIEGDVAGSYDFTKFDSKLHEAMEARQRFSFGIMQQFPWGDGNFNWLSNFSGTDQRTGQNRNGNAAYPLSWHTAMQAESIKDWIGESGDWVPNFNSASYLTKWNDLHAAINTHLQTGSYQPTWASSPIPYKNVIGYIDIRGFGSWGEWHVYGTAPGNNVQNFPNYNHPDQTNSTFPTIATFKSIVDAHVDNYQDFRLVIITNALDARRLQNTGTPAEVAAYIYQQTTTKGFIGFRMDHFGDHTGDNPLADDSYDDFQLQRNPSTFSGFRLDTAFENRYRLAPYYGEPPGGPTYSFGIMQGVFPRQVRKWRVAMVGNGNFGQGSTPSGQAADSVRQGYREAGYHLRLTGGSAVISSQFTINLKWRNFGLTPTYFNWTVEYKLKNGAGTTVWTNNSSFNPYLFLPDYGEQTKTDVYAMPGISAGNYGLYVTVKDPTGYMAPLPLQITGRDSDGSYFLSNITIPTGTANIPPTANAGPNQSITVSAGTLNGSGSSDPDGTITGYLWSQVTGPNTATISTPTGTSTAISGLVNGNYNFNLRVTDDDGATANDQVQVSVNPANIAPIADAGVNQSITLPTSTATLNGSGSSDDIGVTSYLWSHISGPVSVTIASPNTASTGVSGMTSQGTYSFRLLVSDVGGLTDDDTVSVTVLPGNQAPVSNPGANQTIQLPTSSATVNGSGSTDDVAVTSYLWAQIGGPATATVVSPTSVSTNITGMSTAGIYTFRLTVGDGGGLTNSRNVQITVLAAANSAPVSDAGAAQSITLPTSSVTLNGSGSTDDVSISTYAWSQVSGPITATIVSPSSSSTSVTGLAAAGLYVFSLTVTDGGGLTNSDTVQITVQAAFVQHQPKGWSRRYIN